MTTRLTPSVRDAATRWIADDPHPGDRAELQGVLAAAMAGDPTAITEVVDRMSAPLAFGTAGLRGPLRAGPAGMNLAVVRRAAAGLAAYLVGRGGGTVVVGYDARHRSAEFASDVAGVLQAAGLSVLLSAEPVPTPLTAFATRHLSAAAGVQITASHNPPQDNGMKVYLAGGTQLVGPADADIERAIAAAAPARSVDVAGGGTPGWPDGLVESYIAATAALAAPGAHAVRVALTPMHGVGGAIAVRALHDAGFTDVHVVAQQAVPDPDFPTVAFPNPEEPGATDLLLALADRVAADLAVALDPDADRCAIGVRFPDGWRMLRGDETGVLLGDLVLSRLDRALHPDPLVATTIVSSQMLAAVAAAHGARYDETLTGFKWIVRAGDGAGTGLVYGYEEALGLCVDPATVRDKDGISAAVLAADLVASLRAVGSDVPARWDELTRRHGLFVTDQVSVRVTDLALIGRAMARLRADPPTTLAGAPATTTDLLPRTDGLTVRSADTRVVIRPSGTEPKLKCYLEISAPVTGDLDALRAAVAERMRALTVEVRDLVGLG
ncbi:phosphomannomutase [Nakamurella flavida]|nr:phospho-sugar mutase [Nakamurella flavida]MDP9777723.1 phosphomannomutase [Nakamurella flavida]